MQATAVVRLTLKCVALVWALTAAGATQAMTLREFHTLETQEKKNGKVFAGYYLVGVMEGLREARDASQRNGQKPPFCVENRKLEPATARSLFQTELGRNAELYEADMPVQLVMANALANNYRCTQ